MKIILEFFLRRARVLNLLRFRFTDAVFGKF